MPRRMDKFSGYGKPGKALHIQSVAPDVFMQTQKHLPVLVASAVLSMMSGAAHAQVAADATTNGAAAATNVTGTANVAPAATPATTTGTTVTTDASGKKTLNVSQIVVSGKKESRADADRNRLAKIPGGTSVVDSKDVEKGSTVTNADVLALQPGVFAQSAGGTDGLKISIRGSDINSGTNYFRTGILFLFDGLPVTGPGGTPYELFEPLGLSYTDVLRGANAFDVGALSLGGAINYVTKTGYDAAPFQFRVEGGSFGYNKEQVSSGGVIGNFDYYASFTHSYRTGYEVNSAASATGILANFGYQLTADLSTRLYIRYRQTDYQYTGSLTNAQIAANPRQAQSPYYTPLYHSYRDQPGSTWIADKTTFRIDDTSQIEGGFVYHNYPIEIGEGVNWGDWGYTDLSGVLQYKRIDSLFGDQSDTQIGVIATRHLNGWQDTVVRIPTGATAALPVGTTIRQAQYGGQDVTVHVSNDTEIAPRWWLTTGLALSNSYRSTEVTYPSSPYPGINKDTWGFEPRIGLRFTLTPNITFYGNVSRSVEPPMDWEYLSGQDFTTGPATGLTAGPQNLLNQSATTYELGTTGKLWNNTWSLTLYHSDVRNELLEVNTGDILNPTIAYMNASRTTHQGIEASLNTVLFQRPAYAFSYRQAYTLSDFHYNNDPVFGTNRLPGIPLQFYQGQLRFDATDGFYASGNVTVSSRVEEDFANTTYARGYAIFGVTLGYEQKNWNTFLTFSNITNKHYASTVSPTYNNKGVDTAQLTPGDGAGVFAGLSYSWK